MRIYVRLTIYLSRELEEKGRGPARIESLAAVHLAFDRTQLFNRNEEEDSYFVCSKLQTKTRYNYHANRSRTACRKREMLA